MPPGPSSAATGVSRTTAERAFELMFEGEDGWSNWVHPLPGYQMKCCGCGLVHDMEFAIGARSKDAAGPDQPLNDGESDETGVIIFRARREAP